MKEKAIILKKEEIKHIIIVALEFKM